MNMSLTSDGLRRNGEAVTERARTAHLAQHLSSLALRQSERALTGIVALPAAMGLALAAAAVFGAAVLERTFEVFETALGEVGRSLANDRRDGVAEQRSERAEARA